MDEWKDGGMQPETQKLKEPECHPLWGLGSDSLLEVVWKDSGIVINDLFHHYSRGRGFELESQLTWRTKLLKRASVNRDRKIRTFGRASTYYSSTSFSF